MPTTRRFLKIDSVTTNADLQIVLSISRCTSTTFSNGEEAISEVQSGDGMPLTIKTQFDFMRYFDVKNVSDLVGQCVPDCYSGLSAEYGFLAYVYNAKRVWIHAIKPCVDHGPAFDLTVSLRSLEKEINLSRFDKSVENLTRGISHWLGSYQTGHVILSSRRVFELAQIAGVRDGRFLSGSYYTLSCMRYFVNPVDALASVI